MEDMPKHNLILIPNAIEPFVSYWGVTCKPQYYKSEDSTMSGFILPLGWEDELSKRDIEFEVIEIEESSVETLE